MTGIFLINKLREDHKREVCIHFSGRLHLKRQPYLLMVLLCFGFTRLTLLFGLTLKHGMNSYVAFGTIV